MKSTEQWIAKQQHVLPDCEGQHITFTMPHLLWPFFSNNWPLLNNLFRCATRKRGSLLPLVYEALQMTPRKKPEKPGFAVLMKGFLGTDPYKCILCGDRLRFTSAQAGTQAMALLLERLRGMEKKRWLRMPEPDQCT